MHTIDQRAALLDLAERSLTDAFAGRATDLEHLPSPLRAPGSAFVTLHVDGTLNGCIGTIDEPEPIGQAIARLARSAAFEDPRLSPLRPDQLGQTEVKISLLSDLEPIPARSRDEVLRSLRPSVDGLLLEVGGRRGVFLPEVWDQLPDGESFLDQLLAKAGLRPGTWPRRVRAYRFTTDTFSRRLTV